MPDPTFGDVAEATAPRTGGVLRAGYQAAEGHAIGSSSFLIRPATPFLTFGAESESATVMGGQCAGPAQGT